MKLLRTGICFILFITSLFAQITNGCDLPDGNLNIAADGSVYYNSTGSALGGFQFTVEPPNIILGILPSGDAYDGFGSVPQFNAATGIILSFSTAGTTIPAGCGTLMKLILAADSEVTGVSGIMFTVPSGLTNIDFEAILTISPNGSNIPDEFSISQNYPNPFNPVTSIAFDVDKLDEISLAVYDLSGKEVITLASGTFMPGSYIVNWNAVNNVGDAIASGMYLYRYMTSDKAIVRKMLYLK